MAIQTTTAGRNSEYHGELVIHSIQSGSVVRLPVKTGVFPYKDHNNIPAPAVVYKQIRIGMPRSLLKSLKILAKSKRIGVTKILLDVIREHAYAYRYGLEQQQQQQQHTQPPQSFNNQYYPLDILPSEDTDKTKFFHLRLPGDLFIIRHLARTVYQMTLNDFVIQILADRMAKELMNDPTLFLHHIPDY
jgi:hypothetical protein